MSHLTYPWCCDVIQTKYFLHESPLFCVTTEVQLGIFLIGFAIFFIFLFCISFNLCFIWEN